MFSYIRLLSVIALILIVGGGFIGGSFLASHIEKTMFVPTLEKTTRSYVNAYVQQVWGKHSHNLSILNKMSKDAREAHEAFLLFIKHTEGFVRKGDFEQFSIYSPLGDLVFSTNKPEESFPVDNPRVQEAGNGKAISAITGAVTYKGKEGKFLRVFIPIILQSGTEGIIEIIYDLSIVPAQVETVTMVIWVVLGGIVGLLAISVFVVAFKAERIIEKLHETNVELTTARDRAENESREKSKFLANVSHELRTPLNAIIGFSDIMKNETMGPLENDQYKDYVRDINNSGVHLLSLINDILDYSKAEAGKLEVEFVNVDVTKLLKTSLRLVLPRAEEAKIRLIDEVPKKHIVLCTDPKRFKQVILNFLSNSVKFTPEGGEVKLMAIENNDNTLTVRVQDNGIGISHKNIAKAMSTFGQVDSSLSRRYEGTGLGLPFSKKLVEMMGGTFDLQSEEGLGTTITLIFPMPEQPTRAEGDNTDLSSMKFSSAEVPSDT